MALGQHNLFGRELELSALRHELDRASAGEGQFVLVSGEAGIGKTSLLHRFGQEAAERGCPVYEGRSYDLAVTPPFGPWLELLSHSPLFDATTEDGHRRIWDSSTGPSWIRQQVETLMDSSEESPANVIMIDDAHWADQASLDLIRILGRNVHQSRSVLLVAYRSEEVSRRHPLYSLLPALVRESAPERLALQPLGNRVIRDWIGAVYRLSEVDEDRLAGHLQSHAEGNPFFAGEILRSLQEDGILRILENESWSLGDLGPATVPLLLRQVIDNRISRLPDVARERLNIASIIGHDVALNLWASVLSTPPDELIRLVEEATDAALVQPSSDGLGFSFHHAIIRDALYEGVSPARRRVVHQQVGELVGGDSNPDPDVVAYHFEQARDDRAVEWLVAAGDRAWEAWAWTEAADRFQRAIRLLESDGTRATERAWLLLRLAETRRYNLPLRALDHVTDVEAIAAATNEHVLATAARWVRGRIRVANSENGLPQLEQAVTDMAAFDQGHRDEFEREVGFRVDQTSAILAVWLGNFGHYEGALESAERYLASAAGGNRSPLIDAEAWLAQGISYGAIGRIDQARVAFESALDVYQRQQDNLSLGHTSFFYLNEVLLPFAADDLPERTRIATIGDRAWQRADEVSITRAPIISLHLLLIEGDWDRLRDIAGRTVGLRNYVRDWTAPFGAAVARYRGDFDLARAFVDASISRRADSDTGVLWTGMHLLALRVAAKLEIDAGRLGEAEKRIRDHRKISRLTGRLDGLAESYLLQARLHLARGQSYAALKDATEALTLATSPRQPLCLLRGHRLLAEILIAREQPDRAAEHLASAAHLADATNHLFEQGQIEYLSAVLLRMQGRHEASDRALDRAESIARNLGAWPLLERVEYAREQSPSADEFPDDLTGREVDVLRLIAEGFTDTEIAERLSISPRTVMTHVSHILGKTGSPSRAAAAAYAVRQGLA